MSNQERMYEYILTHEHRFGTDTYPFLSNHDGLEEEYFGFQEGEPYEPSLEAQRVISELGLDIELDRMDESFSIQRVEVEHKPEVIFTV